MQDTASVNRWTDSDRYSEAMAGGAMLRHRYATWSGTQRGLSVATLPLEVADQRSQVYAERLVNCRPDDYPPFPR